MRLILGLPLLVALTLGFLREWQCLIRHIMGFALAVVVTILWGDPVLLVLFVPYSSLTTVVFWFAAILVTMHREGRRGAGYRWLGATTILLGSFWLVFSGYIVMILPELFANARRLGKGP
jgi:hypothetical protein